MKTIDRSEIPEDFSYYRTGSRIFFEYYKKYTKTLVRRVGKGYEYIMAGKFIGNVYVVNAEKIDQEPDLEMLRQMGIRHGIIYWSPMRVRAMPAGWFRLPSFYAKNNLHSSRSAFSVLDTAEYWSKWAPSARSHRKKALQFIEAGTMRIEETSDMDAYLAVYGRTKVSDPYQKYLIQWCQRVRDLKMAENIRIYIVYINDEPLAGGVFIDEGTTSEYFTSFYGKKSRPYQPGIALMDRWFHDSYGKWMKYCDLDHLYEFGQSSTGNAKGYTKFKESIADHDVYFHDLWVRFF